MDLRDSNEGGDEVRDLDEFARVIEEHADRVLRLVASVLGPYRDVEAEDVVQEVFLRAYQKLDQFRGGGPIGPWISRIAWTQALNRRQTARFRLPHLPVDALAGLADERASVDHLGEAAERELIARHLEALPDACRAAIYMHYWLDTGVEEIASSLGVPPGTVKSYLSRGRDRLRRSLENEGMKR